MNGGLVPCPQEALFFAYAKIQERSAIRKRRLTARDWRICIGHHSFGAEYDANKPITLSGVVTKVEWTNPHSFFYFGVEDASGKITNWKLEGFPPNVLYRTGWKKDVTIKQGDEITVTGWHARDGGS